MDSKSCSSFFAIHAQFNIYINGQMEMDRNEVTTDFKSVTHQGLDPKLLDFQ